MDDEHRLAICNPCGDDDCACCLTAAAQQKETLWDKVRALVIGMCGLGAMVTPLYILHLSYQDAVRMKAAWVPDERILVGMLAAFASITFFAWRTK